MIFQTQRFSEGSWETPLRSQLKKRRILGDTDKIACRKHWTATTAAWIQFEPEALRKRVSPDDENPGATCWMMKPTVLADPPLPKAFATSRHHPEMLYAGLYVERGYTTSPRPDTNPYFLMHDDWHWHLFLQTLDAPTGRLALDDLMQRLPEANRGIWFLRASGTEREASQFIPYRDASSLDELETLIKETERTTGLISSLASSFHSPIVFRYKRA
jgi:hypothetical protein